ncbi:MAG: T9SS type A sorting domain-containing protein [bacterium]
MFGIHNTQLFDQIRRFLNIFFTFCPKSNTIWIPYKDDDNDGKVDGTDIPEDNLKALFWNGRDWVRDFDTTIDKINNLAKFNTSHLTTFGLFIAKDLDDVVVYPNPFKSEGHNVIRFEMLTDDVTIRIYNIAGELVRIEEDITTGYFDWDAKNDSGEKVVSGVYIYIITDDEGRIKKGKLAIIR